MCRRDSKCVPRVEGRHWWAPRGGGHESRSYDWFSRLWLSALMFIDIRGHSRRIPLFLRAKFSAIADSLLLQ
jgi:hypothetical protein